VHLDAHLCTEITSGVGSGMAGMAADQSAAIWSVDFQENH